MALQGKVAGQFLSKELQLATEESAGLAPGSIRAGEYDPDVLVRLAINSGAGALDSGEQLSLISKISKKTGDIAISSPDPRIRRDEYDVLRSFGYLLLPRDDKAFGDPKYLAEFFSLRRVEGHSDWGLNDPSKAYRKFTEEFRSLAPKNVSAPGVFF